MIGKRTCHCTEKDIEVEAIVEEKKAPRGGEARYAFLRCSGAAACDKSTFCRFVNPLTTRNPLELAKDSSESAA
jgi:hypothetical protein